MATKPFSLLSPAILLPGNEYCRTDNGRHGDAGVLVVQSPGPPGVMPPSVFISAARVCSGHLPGDAPAHGPWAARAPLGSLRSPVLRAGRDRHLRSRPDPSADHREDENCTDSWQAACMGKKVHIVKGPYKIVG